MWSVRKSFKHRRKREKTRKVEGLVVHLRLYNSWFVSLHRISMSGIGSAHGELTRTDLLQEQLTLRFEQCSNIGQCVMEVGGSMQHLEHG